MLGKVTIEEAYTLPREAAEHTRLAARYSQDPLETLERNFSDITGNRIDECDRFGIGMQILSYAAPGPQVQKDRATAEALATEANDWIAEQIRGKEDRLRALACLSMHDPKQAAAELRRCVTRHGFVGALVNDYQLAGADGEDYIFYDQPEFDPFWEAVQELDVPFYLHPIPPTGKYQERWYARRPWLQGPTVSFANGVSVHVLGMVVNGVFDRFPRLQVIMGHMGEHVVGDLWRVNHFLENNARPKDLPCRRSIREYFARNLWISTSGFFSTPMLNLALAEVGADRILFAVDYPMEWNSLGCEWFDNVELSVTDKLKIGRENAKKLFKLGTYKDSENMAGIASSKGQ